VRLLLDTHVLLWAAGEPQKLSKKARRLIDDRNNILVYSVVSLWEIVIKQSIRRDDFRVDARVLRRGLIDNGYAELAVTGAHAVALDTVPPLHKDPFDRMLLAQAQAEGITLLTADTEIARYPGAIERV
jgi:PIN domain nuclease of toxin-antitoxin system